MIAAAGCLVWLAQEVWPTSPQDPVISGHKLSYWLIPDFNSDRYNPQQEELNLAGLSKASRSDMVNYLVHTMNTREGVIDRRYARLYLRLPDWLGSHLPDPFSEERRRDEELYSTYWILGALGTNARPAIPTLVFHLTKDPDEKWRFYAARDLGKIANTNDVTAVKGLVMATKDRDIAVQQAADEALTSLGPSVTKMAGVTNLTDN